MSKLLYIQTSPRGKESFSIRVADAFVDAYRKKNPDDEIKTMNVFEESLPSFDGFTIDAKYAIMRGKEHSPEQLQAWKKVEQIIEQFKSADKYILAVPMWNFSIPYRLKQYIDIIVQPGYTFGYSDEKGYEGLAGPKPFAVVYARGGKYDADSGAEALDLQSRYIELILGFMGFKEIKSIIVEPTLQDGPDIAEKLLIQTVEKAEKIAEKF
jgi:FMN-dependent NADH-azoreductase